MTAKAQFITTKYGTRINVTGLSPEQVGKVRTMAEGKGAYGSKGAALAATLQKQNAAVAAKAPKGPTGDSPQGPAGGVPGNQPGQIGADGQVIPGQIPGQTGATGVVKDPNAGVDPTTGAINPAGFLGAMPKIVGGEDLRGDVDAARAGTYGYITQHYAQQKQKEMNDAKQELANRGIPLDPSPNGLYGRTLAQIDQKYQALDDQAKNQSITAGNSVFGTEATASTNAFGAFSDAVLGISKEDMTKFGIDQDTMTKLKQIAASKSIAAKTNQTALEVAKLKRTGGGGGGSTDDSFGPTAP